MFSEKEEQQKHWLAQSIYDILAAILEEGARTRAWEIAEGAADESTLTIESERAR